MTDVVIRAGVAGDRAGLAEVLVDCVAGGASIGFLHPFDHERAAAFWSGLLQAPRPSP